ncbi:MAG: helix-turn-helix transcriptional regulator [Alphaproteobacteria bacterium]|nr:helix-turn-helix transcriptional regulator [Alphaproteobacteria bacterium]
MLMITGSQIRGARGLLNWSQDNLAEISKVSRRTVQLIESEFPARSSNLRKIHQTLTDHGIEFLQGAGIKLRSKGFHDFIGAESCDDFFDYAQRTIRDRGGDLVCMIAETDMLTKTCCSSGLTNIQRLEQIQKTASVKCLIDEALKPSFLPPSFEVRIFPDEPTVIPISVFVFGNQWVGGFQDDDKTNFTFVVFNKAHLASKTQDYFLPRWHEAKAFRGKNRERKAQTI